MYVGLILFVLLLLFYYIYLLTISPKSEPFINYISNENVVIQVYQEILQRLPSQKELVQKTRSLNDGIITECILRQQLIDSDEYSRAMKIQSNNVKPELERIISDRKLLGQIAILYNNIRNKTLPPKMGLPLKDIFIHLNYNIPALTEVFKDPAYTYFETDVTNALMDKEEMLNLFDETFPTISAKRTSYKPTDSCPGIGDNKGPGASSTTLTQQSVVLPTPTTTQSSEKSKSQQLGTSIDGLSKEQLKKLKESSLDPQLQAILMSALAEFDKDGVAKKYPTLADSSSKTVIATQPTIRLYEPTHEGDMVLRPEYSWSVPAQRTPVCTTLGLKQHIEPVVMNSTLMNGTNLEEATSGTSVGSIMPKFDYRNYVEIPLKK